MTSPRLLGPLPLLGALVAVVWGLQWLVAYTYTPPERLRYKAAAVAAKAKANPRDLVILGTCMSEQQIHADLVSVELGAEWTIHNLGGRASGPIDWYLMVKNKLPADGIEGIVVAWIRGDLETNPSVWEGQTVDLAEWDDVPRLARESCDGDPGCALDVALRKGLYAHRYRGFVANLFWQSLGAKPRTPAAVPTAGNLPPPPEADPLQDAPKNQADAPPADALRQEELTHAYLRSLLTLAQERGIPIWFARMPERNDAPDGPPHPPFDAQDRRIRELVGGLGGKTIDLPVLPMRAFIDDRHVNAAGVDTISRALGKGLREELAAVIPAAPAAPPP